MARPRGSGLNVTRKRRADGSVLEYFYNRRTGAFLGHDREAAATRVADPGPKAAEAATGTFSALVTEYFTTPEYRKLKPRTRQLYRGYLDQLRTEYGDLPIRGIRPSFIEGLKNRHQDTPSKANMILALFRILLGLAVRRDYIKANPALNPGRLSTPPRVEVWPHEDEERFRAAADSRMRLAFTLLLYTVQRPSDVLGMGPERISERDGRMFIALRQSKTDALLDVPVHASLAPMLRDRVAQCQVEATDRQAAGKQPRRAYLVASPTGLLWPRRNFSRSWDAVVRRMNLRLARAMFSSGSSKAEIRAELAERHRQRRDLRRTGVVRLAEAGATTAQIAAICGHAIDYCQGSSTPTCRGGRKSQSVAWKGGRRTSEPTCPTWCSLRPHHGSEQQGERTANCCANRFANCKPRTI